MTRAPNATSRRHGSATHVGGARTLRRGPCDKASPSVRACATRSPRKLERRFGSGRDSLAGSRAPGSVHAALARPGRALEPSVRAAMEPRLGHDLGHVRIHTDDAAARSARDVRAKAYTVGAQIAFAPGTYAPATSAGKHLLAHELAHVMQSDPNGAGSVGRQALTIGAADDAAERQARAVAAGASMPPRRASPALRREPEDEDPRQAQRDTLCENLEQSRSEEVLRMDFLMLPLFGASLMPSIFLRLKRMRLCFPGFDLERMRRIAGEAPFLPDDTREMLSKRHRAHAGDDSALLWEASHAPFAGYTVAGVDMANRFTSARRTHELGYDPASGSTREETFAAADILVFSGHQYAQYKAPGVWANHAGSKWFDIRAFPGPMPEVKIIVSTSCATLCREAAAIWKDLFPNAIFLGYKASAPLEGGAVAAGFAKGLPRDLILEGGGVSAVVSAWKTTVEAQERGSSRRQPGWLDVAANTVHIFNGKDWTSFDADSDENKCRLKGDYSRTLPDPRTPAAPSGDAEGSP